MNDVLEMSSRDRNALAAEKRGAVSIFSKGWKPWDSGEGVDMSPVATVTSYTLSQQWRHKL